MWKTLKTTTANAQFKHQQKEEKQKKGEQFKRQKNAYKKAIGNVLTERE